MKRKVSAEQYRKFEQASIQHLRQHINPKNEAVFFDDFVERMESDPFSRKQAGQRQLTDDMAYNRRSRSCEKKSRERSP